MKASKSARNQKVTKALMTIRPYPVASLLACGLLLSSVRCTTDSTRPTASEVATPSSSIGQTPAAPAPAPAPDPCLRYRDDLAPPPIWLKEDKLVVSRILAECVTADGHKGYRKDTAWVAMGFPCAGGRGKIDVGGHLYAPKIVSLIMATDCPMQPSSPSRVSEIVHKKLQLDATAKLLAYNPFAVQYWEVPGLADANVGFTIDLRSVEAKQRLWREFTDRKPLAVKLYGRENAWVLGHHFYFVDGELLYEGPKEFRLVVKQAKALNAAEVQEVKERCEALRPRRNCHLVFN